MTNAIQFSSLCNKSAVPADQPHLIYILSELFPGAAMANVRVPLNLTLLLDHSGSMSGEKIRNMKAAVKTIIDQLEPNDVISIVTFESNTRVLVPAQPAYNKEDIKRKVDQIRDSGGTTMAPAIREAIKQVSQHHGPNVTSRIVLLTDGEATDKETDSYREADNAGGMGIPIIGMGFGTDWKEDFIFDIADRSLLVGPGSRTGDVWYVEKPEEATSIFQRMYQNVQVVAREVAVNLRLVQGIEARRVWQVTPLIKDIGPGSIQGRAVIISVGELAKEGAAYLVELTVPPRPAGMVRVAQADVTYDAPGGGSQRQATDIIVQFSPDPALYNQFNGRVMNVVEKVQAFKLQTQALSDAESGNVQNATRKLRQAVTILLNQGENELAQQMQQEANHLEQAGQMSNEGKKTIKLTSRKTVKLSDMGDLP